MRARVVGVCAAVCGAGVLLAVPSGAAVAPGALAAAPPATKVVVVNVGQGDGVVIRVGGKIIVSDAGESFAAGEIDRALAKLTKRKQIDVAILSHAHDDHVGGFEPLMRKYGWRIRLALAAPNAHWNKTKTNRRLLATLKARKTKVRWVRAGQTFRFGGGVWRILGPPKGAFGADRDVAEASVVYLLTSYKRKFLFTGDIEGPGTAALLTRWKTAFSPVDVFLVTHHGSGDSTPAALVEAIKPRHAVISAGENGFGHPVTSVVERLEQAKTRIWCTGPDANGDITVTVTSRGRLGVTPSGRKRPWSQPMSGRAGTCGQAGTAIIEPPPEQPGPPPTPPGGGDCHPAYDPCLPIVSDLDCGEIPAAKKPVRVKVIGQDPYRLDADKDGVGCEP